MTGFKNFILRGNLVELAVAVVIGTQFSSLVKQFVSSFVNPLLSLVGQRCPECTAEITPATDQPQPVGRLVRRHRHLCCRLQTMMEPMRMALAMKFACTLSR